MSEPAGPDPRTDPPGVGEERHLLEAWLDFHRDTLLLKCDALSDAQLKEASCPPSGLTLLGLVRHLAEVERGWLARYVGADDAWIYCTADDPDGDFDNVADADVAADLATYRAEVALYRDRLPAVSLDAGAVGYLLKDAEPEDVLDGIRAAARGESPLHPRAARQLLTARASKRGSPVELTPRETEVLSLVRQGLANKQIARRLGISERTVKAHLTSTFQRIGVADRTQAALWAERHGVGTS